MNSRRPLNFSREIRVVEGRLNHRFTSKDSPSSRRQPVSGNYAFFRHSTIRRARLVLNRTKSCIVRGIKKPKIERDTRGKDIFSDVARKSCSYNRAYNGRKVSHGRLRQTSLLAGKSHSLKSGFQFPKGACRVPTLSNLCTNSPRGRGRTKFPTDCGLFAPSALIPGYF